MRCFIEERLKRLEKERKDALEVAQETNQKTEKSKKGKQSLNVRVLIAYRSFGPHSTETVSVNFSQSSFL
jgi:hypothetical protein